MLTNNDKLVAQLHEQLDLQHELNTLVNTQWLAGGNNWTDAMMVEGVEALEHYGWKWWKHQTPDMAQVHIELVDIWHFILSHALVKTHGNHGAAAGWIIDALEHPEFVVFVGYHAQDLRELGARDVLRAFIGLSAGGIVSVTAFDQMLKRFELSWDELHRIYIAKNVLNIFRQQNGYKLGTYIKMWAGKEDNEVLHGLLAARPGATANQLLDKLGRIYSNLPKELA